MTPAPEVSVILPTYNRASTLPRAIHSVLTQRGTTLELIVVDDNSTDSTPQLMLRWKNDSRVRYIRRDRNGGDAAARNTGLQQARGIYVAFQDSDDEWRPEKLERQLTLLSHLGSGYGAVTCTALIQQLNGAQQLSRWRTMSNPAALAEVTSASLIEQFSGYLQTILVRNACFNVVGTFDESFKISSDFDWLLRLTQHYRIADVDFVGVTIFETQGSLTSQIEKRAQSQRLMLEKHSPLLNTLQRAELHYSIGISECLLRQQQPALEKFRECLALNPRHRRARLAQWLVRLNAGFARVAVLLFYRLSRRRSDLGAPSKGHA